MSDGTIPLPNGLKFVLDEDRDADAAEAREAWLGKQQAAYIQRARAARAKANAARSEQD